MLEKRFERRYVSEFVYGGIDGTITTFAIVAGALGASLDAVIVLILGFANLFADGFSMAVSNYLSVKSEGELVKRHKHKHYHLKDPRKTALATLVFFLIIGFIPLLSFVAAGGITFVNENKFLLSFILTGVALATVGAFKGKIVGKHYIKSSLETLFIGGIAALLAFVVGFVLRAIVG